MWTWLSPLLDNLIPVAAIAVATWIAKKIKTPSDLERAQLLSKIANAAAALVWSLNPNAKWADLLRDVIQSISSASGLPTKNAQAIERAAADALMQLGLKPDAGK